MMCKRVHHLTEDSYFNTLYLSPPSYEVMHKLDTESRYGDVVSKLLYNPIGYGNKVSVVFAPLQSYRIMSMNQGSLPNDPAPLHTGFIAGHLLNNELGGCGNAINIIPLSRRLNSEHSKIENEVKAKINRLYTKENKDRYDSAKPPILGLGYSVEVIEPFYWYVDYPQEGGIYVPQGIKVKYETVALLRNEQYDCLKKYCFDKSVQFTSTDGYVFEKFLEHQESDWQINKA